MPEHDEDNVAAPQAEPVASHTPEPWEVWRGNQIKSIYGYPGMDESQLMPARANPGINATANARRIVACVNACEGHATNFLESVPGEGYALTSKRMIDRAVRAENLNADLLKALEKIALWDPHGKKPHAYTRDDVRAMARAAIAKATKS